MRTHDYHVRWTFKHPHRRGVRLHVTATDKAGTDLLSVEETVLGGLLGRRVISRVGCLYFEFDKAPAYYRKPNPNGYGTLARGLYSDLLSKGWELYRARNQRAHWIKHDYIKQAPRCAPDPVTVEHMSPTLASGFGGGKRQWSFKHPSRAGVRLHVTVRDGVAGQHIVSIERTLLGGLMGRDVVSRVICRASDGEPGPNSWEAIAHGLYVELSEIGWVLYRRSRQTQEEYDLIQQSPQCDPHPGTIFRLTPSCLVNAYNRAVGVWFLPWRGWRTSLRDRTI